jgi:hypothetical protein
MTTYEPLRYYLGGVEQFTVADPRVDDLVAGSESTTPALLHARALLAQAAERSIMIYVGGSSTAEGGGISTGAKRFGDRLLDKLQVRYPNGGTETPVTYGANTPDASVGIHMVNRGSSGSTAAGANPSTGIDATNAAIAVYMWGSNDIVTSDTPAADYEARMRDMIADTDALVTSRQVIHILGNHQPRLVWTEGSSRRILWDEYTQALYNIAADMPDTVIVINAGATFDALWNNGDTSNWAGDGVHVGDSGNAILADCYARALL